MASPYDLLRFAIRGHNVVRLRVLRAAENLCKGEPAPETILALIEEFEVAHARLVRTLETAADRGPAALPAIPHPAQLVRR